MNNSNTFGGIKFESDDSASSLLGGLVSAVCPRENSSFHYDAGTAVSQLGSSIDQREAQAQGSKKRKQTEQAAELSKNQKKSLTNERREERNLREKERSLKITQQIQELRNLLSLGGVIVPKGTKSTILAEAANYIRLLQQHQVRSEMEKGQLVQEVQRIGNGAIGEKNAYAMRQSASQNSTTSAVSETRNPPQDQAAVGNNWTADTLGDSEYRCVFNSCSVGMAIATLGGQIVECNQAFTQLSSYTKQEVMAMTVFNLTSREDLQGAFDSMSKLITPPTGELDAVGNNIMDTSQSPVILRSGIPHRNDLGLSVSLIRGDDAMARYFNVTLVKLPPSPMMTVGGLKPVPATAEISNSALEQPQQTIPLQQLSTSQPDLVHQQTLHMQLQPHQALSSLQPEVQQPLPQEQRQQVDEKQTYTAGMNTPQYTAG